MTPERWTEIRNLLERALAVDVAERADFVRRESPSPEFAAEVERLLAFDERAGKLFAVDAWMQQMRPPEPDATLTGMRLGAYRLLGELGRGGMGTVYLAERADGLYDGKVAIKVLQEGIQTPALAARFRMERQILARLRHPGIARLLDGGVLTDGRPYLVLEYVQGEMLDVFCERMKLDVEAKLKLFLKIADAVQSAHQQLILHLDLKPANILVTPEGEPRLLDFGIARILTETEGGEAQTEATMRLLTPRYASPEQAQGAPLGVGSDVFSLATLLYRMLTGCLPYPIENAPPLEAARILAEVQPMCPSDAAPALRDELCGDLDTILLQALRKEPARRYPTVAAMANDVERHLTAQPVLAHADSFVYRTKKFVKRNRVPVLAFVAVLIVLIASGFAVLRAAVVARQQRAAAERERATADRRLKDVRNLAHSYVFDLDGQLEDIPGTVKVRGFVLKSGLSYLEAMSRDAADDDDLASENAQGYLRIGQVQADMGMPSLSDRAGAWDSMGKALVIRKRLYAKHPGDLDQLAMLVRTEWLMGSLATTDGDLTKSDRLLRDAWKDAQPLLAAGPTAPRYINLVTIPWNLATLYVGNGDLWNLADPAEGMRWLERQHAIIEAYKNVYPAKANDSAVLDARSRELVTLGETLRFSERQPEAKPVFQDLVRTSEISARTPISIRATRVMKATYADYLIAMHEVAEANALIPEFLPSEFDEKATDRMISGDIADTLALLARIDLESGRFAKAKVRIDRSMKSFEQMYASDPEDANNSSELAHELFYLADEAALDAPTRRRYYLRSIEVTQAYASHHPEALSATLLVGKCKLGLARMARQANDEKATQTYGSEAIVEFEKLTSAHKDQPEARALILRTRSLISDVSP